MLSLREGSLAPSTQLRADDRALSNQQSAFSQIKRRPRKRLALPQRIEDDSELLINREDFDLDDLDGEEQFLRTERRVPVRRSPIPKKAASQLKIAGVIAIGGGGVWRADGVGLQLRHALLAVPHAVE